MSSVMIIKRLQQPVTLRLLLQAVPDHIQACCSGYRRSICSSSYRAACLSIHNDRRWVLTSLPYLGMQQNSVNRPTKSVLSQTCSTHILCGHTSGTCFHRYNRKAVLQTLVLAESPHSQALHKQTQLFARSVPLPQAFVEAAPLTWQPYMRLVRWDKPIGNWLLFLPCTWSISLAAPAGQLPDLQVLALFGLGAVLMRGAGCTINDMWDKDFDKKVERTRDRPIASGDITRTQALSFLAVQLSASLAILLTFDWYTVILGASCMGLVVTYPLMKRITYWPQLFLGLTLNWGVLIAWSVVHGGAMTLPGITLYLSTAIWSMIYDSIYSHQDKTDDIMVGVKSTALRFGDNSKYWLSGFAAAMVTGLATTGHLCDQTWPYFAGVGLVAGHLAHQIYSVNLNNPEDCGKTFRSNRNMGLMFWGIIVAANLLKKPHKDEEHKEELASSSKVVT